MTSHRARLTPQMAQYAEEFDDRGNIRWLPYTMYFHPAGYRSPVVNTDPLGFRYSHGGGARGSVGADLPPGPVRLLAGSSTVFGIGATHDSATLSSCLWSRHAPALPWLNFGGRSHNSAQELVLFTLYLHLLPKVTEIVLFSGFNNLGLARLPESAQGDHGAFFNCAEFWRRMAGRRRWGRSGDSGPVPGLEEQLDRAVELTTRHLAGWKLLADGIGARLTYVLQPLATWVRERPAPEERLLFAELDEIADFGRAYGDIAEMDVGRVYAERLADGCAKAGVSFLDLNPVLAGAIGPDDWLFVDRIHFTDEGYDLAARLLAGQLALS